MMNNKGVSAVIATVLIILITVAATAILWRFVMPLITGNIDEGTKCFDTMDQLKVIDDIYTCKNSDSKNISIQMSRGTKDFSLVDIQVKMNKADGNSETFMILDNETTLYPTGDNLVVPGQNEDRVYFINSSTISNAESVQIASMVKISNSKQACTLTEPITLRNC